MARKKVAATPNPEGTKVPTVAEPKVKPVRLDLAPDEHKMLRMAAAESEMPMSHLARLLLVEALKARKTKR